MRSFRYCLLLCFLGLTGIGFAQTTPFSATWNFEGDANGTSSSSLVTASVATPVNVNYFGANPFTTGFSGLGANVQNWSTTVCNNTEYVEITVQPATGATITLTSLTFYFARTAQGPQQLSVRSSVDGFSTDLITSTVATTYQVANIALSTAGFINQTGPITFRIYGCNPTNGGGLLRLDQIMIGGGVLPVDLLYFRAQVVSNRVELAWATVWERNADQFTIERSRDLWEFGALGNVSAKGTTDQTQRYTFTDPFPDGGTTYYRLKQVDFDGKMAYSKPVAVVLDDHTPALVLLGNPVEGPVIQVAARNLSGATFSLITPTGQSISLQPQSTSDGSMQLWPTQGITPGLHWLQAEQGTQRLMQRVLVR